MVKIPDKINIPAVVQFVTTLSDSTKIYVGCDSEKFKIDGKWFADYIMVVVIHIDGNRGCKIFGCVQREPDYDYNKHRPALRLMTEVRKAAELYLELFDALEHLPQFALNLEVHLDLNPDEQFGSSCVLNEAIGYIKGVCGVEPKVKDIAFAASYAADRYKDVANRSNEMVS